jgi:hypothetical protein
MQPRKHEGFSAQLRAEWDEILPTEKVRSIADDLPDAHGVRAADAAQLAAALVSCRERPKQRPFVGVDERLRTAATVLGFLVRPYPVRFSNPLTDS